MTLSIHILQVIYKCDILLPSSDNCPATVHFCHLFPRFLMQGMRSFTQDHKSWVVVTVCALYFIGMPYRYKHVHVNGPARNKASIHFYWANLIFSTALSAQSNPVITWSKFTPIVTYHRTSNISHTKSQNLMFLVLSCSCLCPIHWSQGLSREWRCSWSSADRRCSNYIWVINNLIAY